MKKFVTLMVMIFFIITSCEKESSDVLSDSLSIENEIDFSVSDPIIEYYADLGFTVSKAPSDYEPYETDLDYIAVYLFEEQESTSDTVPSFGEILVLPEEYNDIAITDYWLRFYKHPKGGGYVQYGCTYSSARNCRFVTNSAGDIGIQVLN